jgi:glutamine amidotransferase
MIGIKNFCYPKCKKLIEDFYSLAENGKVPSGNVKGHLDGWGVGWYEDGKSKLYKSANPVIKEKEKFFEMLENIKKSTIVVIHFRKSAWRNTKYQKCAPF